MKQKISIAGWVVINVALLTLDFFVLPEWANDHHGLSRLVGVVGLPVVNALTLLLLGYRIYDRIRTKLFFQRLGD